MKFTSALSNSGTTLSLRTRVIPQLLTVFVGLLCSYSSAHAQEGTTAPEGGPGAASATLPIDEDIAGSVLFTEPTVEPHRFFTFTFQNDVFLNRDFGYTNGFGFTLGKGPFLSFTGNVTPWVDKLSSKLYIRTMPEKIHGIAHMLSQRIQTPEDLTISTQQPDDLPYAGLLALQSTFYAYDRNQTDQFSTFLGLVGPAALAEEAQSGVHKIIGSEQPEGWDTQIENEFVFKVEALRATKLYTRYDDDGHGFDVLGLGRLGLGTISSEALVGAAMRWGSSMEYSHATFSLQADRQVNSLTLTPSNNYFAYIGIQGGYVANDVMIEGNTFRDSASAPLRHEFAQISGGIVFKYGDLAYVLQVTETNSRTTLNNTVGRFGAFSVTWNY